ncbi:FtsH-binding integral membrane protein [Variovorax boronicumulans]|uniref:ABZJ_00895 family protein n=1 Tax=Variovorax boronicumulans TaxID=436515 RepID=UPI00278337ED|nr:ABZJ_00895 family protein [Variovorax boronicumulans]MDP9995863.1 FtsH-binding integral membrane protein [Variovorax boronicumulans]MDQ0006933.1 FtsH-binding integral membrane protein [Variovorax boronicumulans]MDQ0033826.1 FtsH-binding integral membrane protein [Variovorax boronicumulans]
MTLRGLLWRFAAAYVVLLIVVGVALNLAGASSSTGGNMAALLGTVAWVCMDFAKKNGRYFTPEEKKRAVLGMLVIDMAIQAVVTVAVGVFAGVTGLSLGPALLVLLFVGVLHALVIWFFVGFAGKQHAAAEARRNKTG